MSSGVAGVKNVIQVQTNDSATVRNIGEFANELLSAVQSSNNLEIDVSNLIEVDLSFIQLVLAARTHLEQEGAKLTLAQPAGPALAALLDRAGFLGDPQPADIDFWFHGELPQ